MFATFAPPAAAILTAVLLAGATSVANAQTGETGPLRAVGELRVSTEPKGASVYLDGSLVGVTPVTVRNVPAGTHQVRLSLEGYVDRESRIEVPAGGAGDMRIELVKDLTVETAAAAAEETPEEKRRGRIEANKTAILLAGAAVAAAVGVATAQSGDGPNTAPTGGEISGDPPIGLAGVASTLAVSGVIDRETRPLQYTWTFGDGATANGQRVSHTYAGPGFYAISVVASDGDLSTTVTGNHLVTALTGSWNGSIDGFETRVEIRQEGAALAGTLTLVEGGQASRAALTGHVGATAPGGFSYPVEFSAQQPCCGTIAFVGKLDILEGVNRLTGTAQGRGVDGRPWVLSR